MEYIYRIMMTAVFISALWLSKNYLLSFFIFTVTGAFLLTGMNLWQAIISVFSEYLYPQALDITKASILTFITFYCGYVGLMEYGGPIKGFTRDVSKYSKDEKSTQLMAWLSSVVVFFSDLGSPGIVGIIFREKFNKYKIPREKLALIINFTAVPVCSMIPLVGWGLFAIGVSYGVISALKMEIEPIMLFIKSIPYFNFSLLAVITPLLLTMGKFYTHELQHAETEVLKNNIKYIEDRKGFEVDIAIAEEETKGWILSVTVIVMLFTIVFAMNLDGVNLFNVSLRQFMVYVGAGFIFASFLGMLSMWFVKHKKFMQAFRQYYKMFTRVLSVTAILTMSWVFFEMSYKAGIFQSINSFISDYVPAFFIAPLVFITGCILSTVTGSAWGTYAVMIPMVLIIGKDININLFMVVGAAISGSVYGDISAKNSHAAIYSAECAGIDPKLFLDIQKPYMHAIGLSCILTFTADYFVKNIIIHLIILIASYLAVLIILRKVINKKV